MRTLKLYRNDFSKPHNCRTTEHSTKVVDSWFDPMTKYAVEEIPDERCLRLVAERLVIRRILGIAELEAAYEKQVAGVNVFGEGNPKLSDLTRPGVFMAMAFFPLSPTDDRGDPRLARLYCVDGLTEHHELALKGMDEPTLENYSWFMTGVPIEELQKGVDGRSWLLAAHLLVAVVKKRDVQTARNLMTHYIVTGDVSDNKVRIVDMKRKAELANLKQFENFKWIIPKENDMDIPMRKIEKPATLEEAYKLIETMQNKATRSFFRFLKKGDLAGMKEQKEIGADFFAIDSETELMPMALVAKELDIAMKANNGMSWQSAVSCDNAPPKESEAAQKVAQFREIRSWLRDSGADPVMMFYVLAKYGLTDVLRQVLSVWPIDARDEDGYNATELAIKNREYDLAKTFYSLGCRCRSNFADANMTSSLKVYVGEQSNFMRKMLKQDETALKESQRMVMAALATGLSPDCQVSVEGGLKTSLFGAALYKCDVAMIKQCLDSGADPNLEIEIWRGSYIEDESLPEELCGWTWTYDNDASGSPLYIVNCGKIGADDSNRSAATTLLKEFGARVDPKVSKRQFGAAVEKLGSKSDSPLNRKLVLKLLDEGSSFDVLKRVDYVSCEDNPRREELQTTLWGWAVYYGDADIMRKCLERGASVNGALKFSHVGANNVADLQYLNGRSPVEVILMSEDLTLNQQNASFNLLTEFGLREAECPAALLKNRHVEVLAQLKSLNDVEKERTIALDSSECPELAVTNALGMAVWAMWIDVMERCLSLGASARNVLHYEGWAGGPNGEEYDLMSGAPRQMIDRNKNVPSWLRNRAIKLLAKYSNK